ncbi:WXG100 family type VII secretion target [Kitasatospora sp. MAA4]|uniref:WXG100 family type VII secretion target n=1 Tax=Kitasatospora sp. MAA4 TaxID=3035093 RepID=UPI00247679EB|nr:WXG100 family type VII secretion target [Kitasatospora sp. MAA4]MDH6131683.1 WXG100 family type VII secretion target [Kitasatospora sp. MAA4]
MAQEPDPQSAAATPPPPKITSSFDIFSPGGDPGVLRACATAWRGMATDLKASRDQLDHQVSGLGTSWTGQAATGFHTHWNTTRGQIDAALPHFEEVAKQLDNAADSIESVNNQITEIVAEIAATAAIGIGLSIVTAGFSDAAAASAAAVEAGEASAAVARLAKILAAIEKVLETVKTAMEDNKLLSFGVKFAGNLAGNFGGNVLGQAMAGQQVTWGADFQDAAVSAGVGTSLSGLGEKFAPKVADALGTKFAGSGAHAGNWGGATVISDLLKGEGLAGGMFTNGVTSAAGTTAADTVDIAQGKKNATNLWQDVVTSGVGGVAGGAAVHAGNKVYGPGTGSHRAEGSPDSNLPGDAATNGAAYGTAGAAENDLTGEPWPDTYFDNGSVLVDPKGAYQP